MNIIQEIQESWGWIGIDPEEIVGENNFGNLLIKDSEGKFWRLCPEDVYCEVVAETRAELDALSKDQEFLEDWYMQSLTDQAKEALGDLENGRKYHLVIPGVLGGEYAISNIRTVSLIDQVRYSGDLGKQINEMPDGAQIELKVID